MRIAQVAPPFQPIPPALYGDTERVVATLCEELVRRGHDVTLFAAAESRTSARLISTMPQAVWHYDPRLNDFSPFWAMTLDSVWQHADEFDLIHSHLDYWGYALARHTPVPVLTTLHGRLDAPQWQPLYRHFNDVPLVSISDAQRQPLPWANFMATVYHGIDLEEFTFSSESGGYLAFLGRASPEKGLDAAIHVAREAGVPLKVAARLPQQHIHQPGGRADWEYFEQVLQPLLQQEQVEFVGEIAGRDKDAFLGSAVALLFPICWPEPFGLVMVEALACGTPVLALNHGSVPEIIEDGVTGFVRDAEEDLVEAVHRIGTLQRAACRTAAEQRFSPGAMAASYMRVYETLLGNRQGRT